MIVFLALSGTVIASFSTDTAHLTMKSRIASHETRAESASINTIAAPLDTFSHHLYHIAIQAGSGTVFAIT